MQEEAAHWNCPVLVSPQSQNLALHEWMWAVLPMADLGSEGAEGDPKENIAPGSGQFLFQKWDFVLQAADLGSLKGEEGNSEQDILLGFQHFGRFLFQEWDHPANHLDRIAYPKMTHFVVCL